MSLMPPPSTTKSTPKPAHKVALQPGYGPLDWAKLKSSQEDLRQVEWQHPVPISPKMMSLHRGKANSVDDEIWCSFNGKVYNVTRYLPFHPGGEKEVLRVAGRDGTDLFMKTHAWVNLDYMLDECLIGFLVPNGRGVQDALIDDD
ncbi:cytochrome b5 [Wallemia mellicola]|uniref:Cytochrome b5 n=2 Tax=Wallemia mellicola TaxID=1708541 RepID=A0AB74KCL9_9BASI|nr:cytochrome b5 [Wallemia mellicola]TIC26633.1 cytochrome b5 [Wallemia mellicola]TIC61413.1 cytochrome b5 [Wallemia mellicola]